MMQFCKTPVRRKNPPHSRSSSLHCGDYSLASGLAEFESISQIWNVSSFYGRAKDQLTLVLPDLGMSGRSCRRRIARQRCRSSTLCHARSIIAAVSSSLLVALYIPTWIDDALVLGIYRICEDWFIQYLVSERLAQIISGDHNLAL